MKKIFYLFATIHVLTSCSEKKLIVMSKGPAEINTNTKIIKATDGTAHEEKVVTVTGDKVVFKLSTPAGEATVELLENGLYVVNVKNDTIIGSYQNYGDPKLSQNVVTQINLKRRIDSLQLLVEGKNVSKENRNFFILPNKAEKITENTESMVVGPYHRMRSVEKVNGKAPEVYRFYSIKEIRAMIVKMQSLTVAPKI